MKFQYVRNLMRLAFSVFVLFSVGAPPTAFATERGDVRKDARGTRQTGREDARDTKKECREGDEKSNANCRRDKRGSKQDTREESRDIKY